MVVGDYPPGKLADRCAEQHIAGPVLIIIHA